MFVFLFANATITYRSVQELYRGGFFLYFFSDGVHSTPSPFRETRGFGASACERWGEADSENDPVDRFPAEPTEAAAVRRDLEPVGSRLPLAEDGARRAGGTRFAPTEPKARP